MLLEIIAIIFFLLVMIFAGIYSWKLENSNDETQSNTYIQKEEETKDTNSEKRENRFSNNRK